MRQCSSTMPPPGAISSRRLARRGKGLPARVIPIECHSVPSLGIDVLLGAIAYGASQVFLLATGHEADDYAQALSREIGYAQTILSALGYAGVHFHVLTPDDERALESAVWGARARARRAACRRRSTSPPKSARRWSSRSSISQSTRPRRSS